MEYVEQELPRNFIALGRNWADLGSEPEDLQYRAPKLTKETRITISGLVEMANRGMVDSVIFSGGLFANDGTSEAAAMADYFNRLLRTPASHTVEGLGSIAIYEDDKCWDTRSSAEESKALAERTGIEGPFTLLGTRVHLPRAKRDFERENVNVVPVIAEEWFTLRSPHAERYERRHRYLSIDSWKWFAIEGMAWAAGPLAKWLTSKARPNHKKE